MGSSDSCSTNGSTSGSSTNSLAGFAYALRVLVCCRRCCRYASSFRPCRSSTEGSTIAQDAEEETARLVVIPDCGAQMQFDAPDAVTAEIRALVDQATARRRKPAPAQEEPRRLVS